MPESKHALLSASSSHRWLNCNPSARLEHEFADRESEAASEGTAAHALCEHKLRKTLKMRSKKPVSRFDCDEMDACTDGYVEFVMEAIEEARRLAYVKPRMGVNRFGAESVTYEGVGEQKKWLRLESYGPKFVENIVQATARDILAEAMLRLDEAGYRIVMHIHDEVVIEAPQATSLEKICEMMGRTPAWADGLLLRADGFVCDFYKKD